MRLTLDIQDAAALDAGLAAGVLAIEEQQRNLAQVARTAALDLDAVGRLQDRLQQSISELALAREALRRAEDEVIA